MRISFRKDDVLFFSLWLAAALVGRPIFDLIAPNLPPEAWYLGPALSGAVRGLLQGLVVSRRSHIGALWGAATFLGITAYGILAGALQEPLRAWGLAAQAAGSLMLFVVLLQAVQGAAIGAAQWAVLRLEVPKAARWIFFSALGHWAAAETGFVLAGTSMEANAEHWGALASGIITGLGLVWLFNQADDVRVAREANEQVSP
ncbi:MAG: hypothetical protein EPO32_13300 [Anaerolineae bacterium]|nr:MAG: hypothetical protein EPO32_13300 [Anaerolineae bacterium]